MSQRTHTRTVKVKITIEGENREADIGTLEAEYANHEAIAQMLEMLLTNAMVFGQYASPFYNLLMKALNDVGEQHVVLLGELVKTIGQEALAAELAKHYSEENPERPNPFNDFINNLDLD
ncbi:hypothetical protein A2382_03745 [Candidatus Woesebacteria bacterium RIFOXYB1_FULL_38_16]|uniref:Uncharacterized protein n=1 Tax=Candidatus Woesebacteria bacterium RIFOXYB1_FULL_38_16 TaxID=1802538 RepID=A0A1F8CQZ2_9BACT|nr:MAG: hypothetical protein A2191_02235 [Candidatus Woesebacteria bacterium RIFOXYA1_FULL_38_9]OGM78763.1 MAG: hypothetical protein A2382_03745 [Candidatus Woesebacteria bacterium RIFOXYB1_FULL_38_16]